MSASSTTFVQKYLLNIVVGAESIYWSDLSENLIKLLVLA